MAGTVTVTRSFVEQGKGSKSVRCEKVRLSCTADATNGSFPDTPLNLQGYIMKVVTNPGSTAPTDNYDIAILDEHGSDAALECLTNRDTANSETVYVYWTTTPGAPIPAFFCGDYTVRFSNNSVNSATVVVDIYLRDSL